MAGERKEKRGPLQKIKTLLSIDRPLTEIEDHQIETIVRHLSNNELEEARSEIGTIQEEVKSQLIRTVVSTRDASLVTKLLEIFSNVTATDVVDGLKITNSPLTSTTFSALMFATINDDHTTLEAILKKVTVVGRTVPRDLGRFASYIQKNCKKDKYKNPMLLACVEGFTRCVEVLHKYGFEVDLLTEDKENLERMIEMNHVVSNDFHLYYALYMGRKHPDWPKREITYRKKYQKSRERDPVEQYLQFRAFASPIYMSVQFMNAEYKGDFSKDLSTYKKLDPIRTAFACSTYSTYLAEYHTQQRTEYKKVGLACLDFAEDVLDQCEDMEEVELLLEHNPEDDSVQGDTPENSNWGIALWEGHKKFVGHHYYQQYIWNKMTGENFDWESYFLIWKILLIPYYIILFFLFPFVIILDFFQKADILFVPPDDKTEKADTGLSRLMENVHDISLNTIVRNNAPSSHYIPSENGFFAFFREKIHRPFFRVFVHIFIEAVFLLTLMLSLLDPLDEKDAVNYHWYDVFTYILVIQFLLEAIVEFYRIRWRFFSSFWNAYSLLTYILFVLGGGLNAYGFLGKDGNDNRNQWSGNHPANVGSTLFAIASTMAMIRTLRWFLLIRKVGPVILCTIRVVKDIAIVFLLFITTYVAFSLSMYAMYKPFKGDDIHYPDQTLFPASQTFSTFFWVFFNPGEPKPAEIYRVVSPNNSTVPSLEFSHFMGMAFWAIYQGIVVIILINVLIALMNNRYDRLFEMADLEWKYSKSFMYINFLTTRATLPPPFRWIYYLAHMVHQFKERRSNQAYSAFSTGRRNLKDDMGRNKKYYDLLLKLIRRKLQLDLEESVEDEFDDLRKDVQNLIRKEVVEKIEKIEKENNELLKRNNELVQQLKEKDDKMLQHIEDKNNELLGKINKLLENNLVLSNTETSNA